MRTPSIIINTTRRSAQEKIELIKKWDKWFYDQTASFEDFEIGGQIAYLYAAIANDSVCSWPEDAEILQLLDENNGPDDNDPIWDYIQIEESEEPDDHESAVVRMIEGK